MINQEKILKLFKRFAGDVVDLHGLKCVPVGIGELTTDNWDPNPFIPIEFEILNPNDVSYYFAIVEDELIIVTQEFSQYINTRLRAKVLWKNKQPKLYFNEETKNRIQKVFNSVREIKFTTGTPFIGYKKWTIEIESVGMSAKHFDEESYYIDNTVVPISATKDGENINVNEAINTYIDEFLPNVETYYETEEYYHRVDQIINQYPLLSDTNYIATYYDTKFIR